MRFLFLVWTVSAAYGQVWPGLPQRIRFEGVVVDFISGNPIPDVAVSARNCQKILTDAGGRFALECPYAYDVEHSLMLLKPGYSLHGVQNAGSRSVAPGGTVTVLQQLVRQMWAPGKMMGTVVDEKGSPVPRVAITATALDAAIPETVAKTNDVGSFQFDLAPGSYRICATSQFDALRERLEGLSASRELVSACYPSTDVKHASTVVVKAGENSGPFQLRLPSVQTWTLSGRVTTQASRTQDWITQIWAIANPMADTGFPSPEFYRGNIDQKTGSFVVSGLRSGSYTLLARAGPASQCYTCTRPPEYEARLPVQISGNRSGIVVAIHPFSVVAGRVTLDSSGPGPAATMVLLDSGLPARFAAAGRISGNTDGAGEFLLNSVPPGEYMIPQTVKDARFVRSVRVNGLAAALGHIQVAPESSPSVEIALRDPSATVHVRFLATSQSLERVSLLVIPEDGWEDTSSWSGPVQMSGDGAVTIGVRRAGRYLVFAVQNLAQYPEKDWGHALRAQADQGVGAIATEVDSQDVVVRKIVAGMYRQ